MNIATLGVAIDPTAAKAGEGAVRTSLRNIATEAGATQRAVATSSAAQASSVTAAGKALAQSQASAVQSAAQASRAAAAGHQGILSRMAEAVRNFFNQTGTAARSAGGFFQSMIAQVVGFVSRIGSMVPGASASLMAFSVSAGNAATSLASVGAGSIAVSLALGSLAALLTLLAVGFVGLAAGAVVAWRAIAASAEIERLEVQYRVLIGSQTKALETMAELREFADVTPFDTKGVMQWGQEMLNAGIAADDLKSTLNDLGNSALGDANKMSTAVLVLTQSLGKMKVDTMDLRQLGSAGIPIFEGLEKSMGKTTAEIMKLVEEGKVGFVELRAAFAALGGEGGRLSTLMEEMSRTWEGRMSTIRSRWDNVLVAFGTPIRNALLPSLEAVDARLKALIPVAEEFGNAIAGAVMRADWDEIKTFIGAKLIVAGQEIGAMMGEYLKAGFIDAWRGAQTMLSQDLADLKKFVNLSIEGGKANGEAFGKAFANAWTFFLEGIRQSLQGLKDFANLFLEGIKASFEEVRNFATQPNTQPSTQPNRAALIGQTASATAAQQYAKPIGPGLNSARETADVTWMLWQNAAKSAAKPASDAGTDRSGAAARAAAAAAEAAKNTAGKEWTGTGREPMTDDKILEELRRELKFLNDNAGKMSPQEHLRRTEDAKTSATGQLSAPEIAAEKYPQLIEKFRAHKAQMELIDRETTQRMEANTNGMFNSFAAGMRRTSTQWGTMNQQIAALAGGVANSIAGNFSTAFAAMMDGSKSAGEAFRDMAVAILKDIANMIIKLLVQLAIQAAIKALFGDGAAASNSATAATGTVQSVLAATNAISGVATYSAAAPAAAVAAPTPSQSTPSSAAVEPALPSSSAGGLNTTSYDTSDLLFQARGGPVYGGRGQVDDVPAFLTRGEYVIPVASVDHYGQEFLDAVRDKRVAKYAGGGPVGGGTASRGRAGGGGLSLNFTANIDASSKGGTAGGSGSEATDRKRAENIGRSYDAMMHAWVAREKRPGGAFENL